MLNPTGDCEGYREVSVSRHVLRLQTYRSPQRRRIHDRNTRIDDIIHKNINQQRHQLVVSSGRRQRCLWFGKLGSSMPILVVDRKWAGFGIGMGRFGKGQGHGRKLATVDDVRQSCYACLKRDLTWRPLTRHRNRARHHHSKPPWQLPHHSPEYDDVSETDDIIANQGQDVDIDNLKTPSSMGDLSTIDPGAHDDMGDVVYDLDTLGRVVYDLDAYWAASDIDHGSPADSAVDLDSLNYGMDAIPFKTKRGKPRKKLRVADDNWQKSGGKRDIERHEDGIDALILANTTHPMSQNSFDTSINSDEEEEEHLSPNLASDSAHSNSAQSDSIHTSFDSGE